MPASRGRHGPQLSEGAGANGGADVAVASKPADAAEVISGFIVRRGALLISVDRSLIHHEQVDRQPQHPAIRFEDQVFDGRDCGGEWAKQFRVELMRESDIERVSRALSVLDLR